MVFAVFFIVNCMGLLLTLLNYDLWLDTSYAAFTLVFCFFLINQRSCLLEITNNFGELFLSKSKQHLLKCL